MSYVERRPDPIRNNMSLKPYEDFIQSGTDDLLTAEPPNELINDTVTLIQCSDSMWNSRRFVYLSVLFECNTNTQYSFAHEIAFYQRMYATKSNKKKRVSVGPARL